MRLEEQSPPLKAPPPQTPLHHRTIHHAGQQKHIWDEDYILSAFSGQLVGSLCNVSHFFPLEVMI